MGTIEREGVWEWEWGRTMGTIESEGEWEWEWGLTMGAVKREGEWEWEWGHTMGTIEREGEWEWEWSYTMISKIGNRADQNNTSSNTRDPHKFFRLLHVSRAPVIA